MKKPYTVFLVVLLCIFVYSSEFIVLPWLMGKGVSRDTVLMGFWVREYKAYGEYANRLGFTGDEIQLKKSPGTVRILLLGGSSQYGNFFARLLKTKLTRISGRPVEVLNASIPSHTIISDCIKYRLLSKYNFDYVCIYQGINDVVAGERSDENFREDYSHIDPWYKRNFWLDHSLICRVTYNKLVNPQQKQVYQADKGFAHLKVFEKNFLRLLELIRKDEATPIIMTFAWEDTTRTVSNQFNIDPLKLWGSSEYQREGVNRINRFINGVALQENMNSVDQAILMRGRDELFDDPVHFNDAGKELFVDNIVQLFLERHLAGAHPG